VVPPNYSLLNGLQAYCADIWGMNLKYLSENIRTEEMNVNVCIVIVIVLRFWIEKLGTEITAA